MNPRLIVLEEEEVELLASEVARTPSFRQGGSFSVLLRSLVARYEDDGITEEEGRHGELFLRASVSEMDDDLKAVWQNRTPVGILAQKLHRAFTPPTQRSDSE